jgi:cytoskeleton protein RodZ
LQPSPHEIKISPYCDRLKKYDKSKHPETSMKPSDDDTIDHSEGNAAEVSANVPGWIMLQQARLAAGVEIEPLAAVLKVSVRKLQALEAGELNNPREMTFTRALAASVCRQLRIEPGPVLDAWPGQSADATAVPKTLSNDGTPNAATALPASAQPTGGRGWLGVLVVLLIGVGVWMAYQQMQHASERRQARATAQPAVIAPERTEPAAAAVAEAPAASVTEIAPPTGGTVETAPVTPPAVNATQPEAPAKPGPIVNNQSAPLTPAAIGNHILVLHALEASWIEVTDVSGARVFTRLMSAGDHVAIDEGGRPLSVLIGNAAGVRVYSRSKALDLTDKARLNVARFDVN